MMNSLYSNDYKSKYEKAKKKATIIIISLMVGATLINVGLLFLTTEYNKGLMQFITSLIYVIAGWISIYFLITGIISSKRKIVAMKSIINGDKKEIVGKVTKIGKPVTLANSMRCFEISILEGRINHTVYLEEDLIEMPFKENDMARVIVSNNFIEEYEVLENEE